MNHRFVRSILALLAVTLGLSMNMGMRPSGAPGDCFTDEAGWSSVDGGCKDTTTGRVWSASFSTFNTSGWLNYYEAQNYCSALAEGGQTDWRLPTLAEMQAAFANGAFGHIHDIYQGSHKWSNDRDKSKKHAYALRFDTGEVALPLIQTTIRGQVVYSRLDLMCVR